MPIITDAIRTTNEHVSSWYSSFIGVIPNILLAIIVLLLFILAASIVKRIVHNILKRISRNQSLNKLLGILSFLAVFILGFIIALNILDLSQAVISILASVGVAGIVLGFALQDAASNLISGVIIALRKDYPFKIGDLIAVKDYYGHIKDIELRSTTLTTLQGQSVIIPNRQIFESPLTNYSLAKKRRIDLEVGVAYSSDLERVKKIAKKALENISLLTSKNSVRIFFKEFASSSISFTAHIWIKESDEVFFLQARDEAIINIKKAFDKEGITIPFPIRTLDFPKDMKSSVTISSQQTLK